MSKDNKRRSIFARSSLGGLAGLQSHKDDQEPTSMLRKRRAESFRTTLSTATTEYGDGDGLDGSPSADTRPPSSKPPLSRGSGSRASSVFGSLRGLRLSDDTDEPLSATSTRSFTGGWPSADDSLRNRQVLHHGEVQTSSSMFRKKKEYLVLTDTHLIRFKSHAKAAEVFVSISSSSTYTRTPSYRHGQSPSAGSTPDLPSAASETSGDRHLGTPLRQIVAVYQLEDGRPHFAIEISYLDEDTNHASSMTLQFGDPEDMRSWLAKIRDAANRVRLADSNPLSAYNSHLAARVVEAERDYVPPHYAIYKVVQRPVGKSGTRSSSDDLSKVMAPVCFLAIGVHKVHLIPLFKPPSQRTSSPSLGSGNVQSSYGILNITELRVSELDDTFELTFRLPLQRPKVLHLAALASHDIAVRLRYVEENMRPEWESRPYLFVVPDDVKHDILGQASPRPIDHDSLDRTLIGYCVAYDVRPENIRYQVTYPPEDRPRFDKKGVEAVMTCF